MSRLDEWKAQAKKRGKTEVLYADETTHSDRILTLIARVERLTDALGSMYDMRYVDEVKKILDEDLREALAEDAE
jgi:hypothetical protein